MKLIYISKRANDQLDERIFNGEKDSEVSSDCYSKASSITSRVSPIKAVTIPRLELMGGILSARLARNIKKTLTVGKTTFWTDSTNVLYWVHSKSRSFKPFVANRVGEIQRITDPEEWRHIPGEENPADLPTRGLTASQLTESKLWIEGPDGIKLVSY